MAKSTAVAVTGAAVETNGAVAAVTEAAAPIRGKIKELYHSAQVDAALKFYKIGQQVRKLTQDETKYGTGAVQAAAEDIGLSKHTLYNYQKLTEVWTTLEDVQRVLSLESAKKDTKGFRLTANHLLTACAVNTPKTRDTLLRLAREEQWPVSRLKQEVERRNGTSAPRGNNPQGRAPEIPANELSGLKRLNKMFQSMKNYLPLVGEYVLDPLESAEKTEVDEATVAEAAKSAQMLEEVITSAQGALDRLNKLQTDFAESMSAREEDAAEAGEPVYVDEDGNPVDPADLSPEDLASAVEEVVEVKPAPKTRGKAKAAAAAAR